MKSFLDNRTQLSGVPAQQGSVSSGAGFKKLIPTVVSGTAGAHAPMGGSGSVEQVANPNGADAPKVEFVKNGDVVVKIIVSFKEQTVEINCQY